MKQLILTSSVGDLQTLGVYYKFKRIWCSDSFRYKNMFDGEVESWQALNFVKSAETTGN